MAQRATERRISAADQRDDFRRCVEEPSATKVVDVRSAGNSSIVAIYLSPEATASDGLIQLLDTGRCEIGSLQTDRGGLYMEVRIS